MSDGAKPQRALRRLERMPFPAQTEHRHKLAPSHFERGDRFFAAGPRESRSRAQAMSAAGLELSVPMRAG
jgi:hypothetical protein